MNASPTLRNLAAIFLTAALLLALFSYPVIAQSTEPTKSGNLVLWDTLSPVGDQLNPEDRAAWKTVPNDLLLLEKDPPKASSDPGYYGRDYDFKGDAVVETPTLTAAFSSGKGSMRLYSRQKSSGNDQSSGQTGRMGGNMVEVFPIGAEPSSSSISRLEVVRNADDEIVLKVSFSSRASLISGIFSFDKTGVIEVKPALNMKEMRVAGSIDYAVAPAFIGDDLVYETSGTNTVHVPAEDLFLGLLHGENAELVMTWPKGGQRLSLHPGGDQAQTVINSIDFRNDSQSFYLTLLNAPGIWHKETLTPDYLEKDVPIAWKKPFPAKWKTQLYEEDLKTTFVFRESRGEIWRGVAGSFTYPVFFNGDEANYHLGKKVQPKGESLIYCVEGRDTPLTVSTPTDILKQTLGRQASEPILDFAGRKLRTHHRRAGEGVRRACTCGCTEAIQAVFEAGDEVGQKDYIQGALDDMIYFVHCHVERINEYRRFADGLLKLIEEKRESSPELKPFLDSIEEIVRQIPAEYEVQKENMKSFEYADDLSAKTIALTGKKDPSNVKAYMELLKAWRAMGGAQDYVLAKCHVITRNLCQAAGYGCATLPGAMPLAREIRARCRQTLRNPDGYEIWADY